MWKSTFCVGKLTENRDTLVQEISRFGRARKAPELGENDYLKWKNMRTTREKATKGDPWV